MPIRGAHGTTKCTCSEEKQPDQYEERDGELMVVGHVEPDTGKVNVEECKAAAVVRASDTPAGR